MTNGAHQLPASEAGVIMERPGGSAYHEDESVGSGSSEPAYAYA
jgi:hypothetical protein